MIQPIKFMGGKIVFVEAAENKVMADGKTIRSWPKSCKVVEGKKEIKIGMSFFNKVREAMDNPQILEFLEDLE